MRLRQILVLLFYGENLPENQTIMYVHKQQIILLQIPNTLSIGA